MKHYCYQCWDLIERESNVVVYKTISNEVVSIFCSESCFDEFVLENKADGYINEKGFLEIEE